MFTYSTVAAFHTSRSVTEQTHHRITVDVCYRCSREGDVDVQYGSGVPDSCCFAEQARNHEQSANGSPSSGTKSPCKLIYQFVFLRDLI